MHVHINDNKSACRQIWYVQRDWIKLVSSKEFSSLSSSQTFDRLMTFLEETKLQAVYLGMETRNPAAKSATRLSFVNRGSFELNVVAKKNVKNHEPPQKRDEKPCLACSDGATDLKTVMHPTGSCAVWRSLSYHQKKAKVNCERCPFNGLDTKHTTSSCPKKKLKCFECDQEDDHHSWFCKKIKAKS